MIAPLKIRVFNKDFVKVGDIGAPKFVTVIPRFLATGQATVSVLSSDPIVQLIDVKAGSRIRIRDEFDQHLMSGWVTAKRTSGPLKQGLVEYDIADDYGLLDEVLGWVIPENAITAQGLAGTNWTMTGPAESVLKAAVQANAIDRLGLPLVCAADLGRGTDITANLRMDPLSELIPVVDGAGFAASGLGITVQQVDDHLVLDVFEPAEPTRVLTEDMGVVVGWKSVEQAMTASRGVVAGAGEGTLRLFRQKTATDGREAATGRKIERYRDARDTDDPTVMYARLDEILAEGAAKASLSVELQQTENFRYGVQGVRVGDKVSIAIGDVIAITDVLTEVTLSWTGDDGWKATPKVGDIEDSTDAQILKLLARINRELGKQRRA